MIHRLMILCLLLAWTPASAQHVAIPGETPFTTSAGLSVPPFQGSAMTYVLVIPASELGGLSTVNEIAFAPLDSGWWTAPNMKIGIGHVPAPVTSFNFPQIIGGTVTQLGDFADLMIAYDSDISGPFSYTWISRAWSPFGLGATGGIGFSWDGTSDVGIYLTWDNATRAPGTSGSFLTSGPPLHRHFDPSYQAGVQNQWATNGLAVLLTSSLAVPNVIPLGFGCPGSNGLEGMIHTADELPYLGNAAFGLGISQGPAGQDAHFYFAFLPAAQPLSLGGGCFLYLDLANLQGLLAHGFGPAVVPINANGDAWFPIPVPNDPALSGLRLSSQAALGDPGFGIGWTVSGGIEAVVN